MSWLSLSEASTARRLRATGALILALASCSCAGRPLQGVLVPTAQSAEGTSRIPILIATTRQRSTKDAGEMFGSERAVTTSYARIAVSIPPDGARKVGEIQWPASPPGDPSRDFVTASADYLDKPAFSMALADAAKTTRRSKAMIFVHGFNNRFDDAAYLLRTRRCPSFLCSSPGRLRALWACALISTTAKVQLSHAKRWSS